MRKAVFFDRDGVLNVDHGYVHNNEQWEWVNGAIKTLVYFYQQGYLIIVVTNQSGIARGYYGEDDMIRLHESVSAELKAQGAVVEKFYYCPHLPTAGIERYAVDCDCRKPKPGMILEAINEYSVDRERSFLIGDSGRDIEAAEAAGIRGYHFKTDDLWDFVVSQGLVDNNV